MIENDSSPSGERSGFMDSVRNTIDAAISTTERGVLEATNGLRAVLKLGRQQSTDREALSQEFGSTSALSEAIEGHAKTISVHVGNTEARMGEHEALLDDGLSSLARMGSVSEEISAIANMTRMVTINAKIQAAQLGQQGTPFFVIAGEMQELSERVESLNNELSGIASQLQGSLPQVQKSLRELTATNTAFKANAQTELGRIEDTHRDVTGQMMGFIERGGELTQQMVDRSNEIISALSFQDPVRQSLELALQELEAAQGEATEERVLPQDDPLRDSGEDNATLDPGAIMML